MLLEQGQEFRVRERRAVVGQPVEFFLVREREREERVSEWRSRSAFFKRGGGGSGV